MGDQDHEKMAGMFECREEKWSGCASGLKIENLRISNRYGLIFCIYHEIVLDSDVTSSFILIS